MSNIAVIVYGQVREFEIAQKSWRFLKDLNCDFYFSTWSKSYHNHDLDKYPIVNVDENIIKKHFPNAIIEILEENEISSTQSTNSKKMIFHLKNGMKLINKSKKKYEQLVLNRFDNYFDIKSDVSNFIELKENKKIYNNRRGIFINERNDHTIDDLFFIGEFETIKNFIDQLDYDFEINIHDYLANKIKRLGYETQGLEDLMNVCVVRANVNELEEKEINIKSIQEKFNNW